ncbi:MAG TPA: TIGR02757 family protein [Thermodesulfovibrionales bacterium]|nr:TIGR02757 family protein [Thermodesulfovibrionales bacterium]
MASLRSILDRFYHEYPFGERILRDPISFPHRYTRPRDIEIAGFIASCLAYGRVDLFMPVIEKVLSPMGANPHAFVMDFRVRKHKGRFLFRYRFNKEEDIICLVLILHELLRRYSSLEHAFMRYYSPRDPHTGKGIDGLVREIMSIDTTSVYGGNIHPRGLAQLFPSPAKGSACKRMNLFLRWMVRDRDIDFGLWKAIPMNKLVIPLDIHIARISRCLGFTSRTATDWKTALEITEALRELDAADPLKYDFALCHHGISGLCGTKRHGACKECIFHGIK